MILVVVVRTITVVTVISPSVMAVDPMMAVMRPVTGHPDQLMFPFPITGAMSVIRPIANLDV